MDFLSFGNTKTVLGFPPVSRPQDRRNVVGVPRSDCPSHDLKIEDSGILEEGHSLTFKRRD